MATLVIKDLPDVLHKRLKEEAHKAHRSMTGEAIYLLETGLLGGFTQAPPAAREMPVPYKGAKPVSAKLLNRWKRDGLA